MKSAPTAVGSPVRPRERPATTRRTEVLDILAGALVVLLTSRRTAASEADLGQLSAQHAKGAPNV
jgi:hypothetical protein